MCLYPNLVTNRRYTETKKNGGNIPPILDPRVRVVAIGCQQCIECRTQKARQWQVRLLEDIKTNTNGKFVTLTISNEKLLELTNYIKTQGLHQLQGYERDNQIATTAMRLFLERWRKKHKKSLRHWLVTELGHEGTENIHMHGIVWTNETLDEVEKHWQYGFIWKGQRYRSMKGEIRYKNYVSARTVNYIVKYVTKMDLEHSQYRAIILTSPGIGADYTTTFNASKNKYNGTQTLDYYRTEKGHKLAMPIYYRNKIYSDEEREQLWIHKLDKNERWICGEKVDLNKSSMENYYGTVSYHRERSRKLGYGSGAKDWNKLEYEKQRRNAMMDQRIAEAFKTKKARGIQKYIVGQEPEWMK